MAGQPIAKVVMFFGDGRFGWSETYYTSLLGTSGKLLVQASLPQILPPVVELAQARANMLPTSPAQCSISNYGGNVSVPVLEYIRISQVGVPRNTAFYDPQSGEVVNGLGLPNSVTVNPLTTSTLLQQYPADNPYSCIEMELMLGNGLISKRSLSGIPDANICDQGWAGGPWYQLWKNFAKILTNGTWGVASNSLGANAISVAGAAKIVNISQQDLQGRPTIALQTPIVFPLMPNGCPSNYLQIYCYKSEPGGYPNLNGVYRVVASTQSGITPGTVYTLNRSFKTLVPFDMGYAIAYQGPTFTPINAATLTKTTMKKRGRPFGLSRGRARSIR